MKKLKPAPIWKILSACTALLLAACGQKGPLYLPDENGTVVTRPGGEAPQTQPPASPQKPESKDDNGSGKDKRPQ